MNSKLHACCQKSCIEPETSSSYPQQLHPLLEWRRIDRYESHTFPKSTTRCTTLRGQQHIWLAKIVLLSLLLIQSQVICHVAWQAYPHSVHIRSIAATIVAKPTAPQALATCDEEPTLLEDPVELPLALLEEPD